MPDQVATDEHDGKSGTIQKPVEHKVSASGSPVQEDGSVYANSTLLEVWRAYRTISAPHVDSTSLKENTHKLSEWLRKITKLDSAYASQDPDPFFAKLLQELDQSSRPRELPTLGKFTEHFIDFLNATVAVNLLWSPKTLDNQRGPLPALQQHYTEIRHRSAWVAWAMFVFALACVGSSVYYVKRAVHDAMVRRVQAHERELERWISDTKTIAQKQGEYEVWLATQQRVASPSHDKNIENLEYDLQAVLAWTKPKVGVTEFERLKAAQASEQNARAAEIASLRNQLGAIKQLRDEIVTRLQTEQQKLAKSAASAELSSSELWLAASCTGVVLLLIWVVVTLLRWHQEHLREGVRARDYLGHLEVAKAYVLAYDFESAFSLIESAPPSREDKLEHL